MPQVSVLVPVYNAQDYLRQCLDALVGQTLADIEVIAIDDGSTDDSPAILAEYAARDARFRVLSKQNTGYGDSMNQALALATGDYIGISEPDDFVERYAFEALVGTARLHAADVVRCDYYEHASSRAFARDVKVRLYDEFRIPFDTPFHPADKPEVVTVRPSIWAGVYRREFLQANGIDFAPTPGASFQDTSFALNSWFAAETAVVIRDALVYYRTDNDASSVKSGAKAFAVCDEYARASAFLRARGEQAQCAFGPSLSAMRYCSYLWNFNRISPEFREAFARRWSQDMRADLDEGLLDYVMLKPEDRFCADLLMVDPDEFCRRHPEGMEWHGYNVEGWTRPSLSARSSMNNSVAPVGTPMHASAGPARADALRRVPTATGATHHALEGAKGDSVAPVGTPIKASAASAGADALMDVPAENGINRQALTPAVSVIVPVYNVESFIRECVESLRAQTFTDFEVLLVDDGSTDASAAIARLAIGDDDRFQVLSKENDGLSSARNFGIERARGAYMTFLDSDDAYVPEALEHLHGRAIADDLDYLDFTAHSFYDTARAKRLANEDYYERRPVIEGVMTGPELFVAYQQAREYHCSACFHFFKRTLLDSAGCSGPLRFVEGIIHEDELFSPLLIARARRAAYLPEALYLRRVREGSIITAKRGLRNVSSMYEVQKRLLAYASEEVHAGDPAFVDALCQRVAELRGIIAEDAARVSESELAAYSETLAAGDRADFNLVAVQGARMHNLIRTSRDMRVGSALLAAPRWLKHRLIG